MKWLLLSQCVAMILFWFYTEHRIRKHQRQTPASREKETTEFEMGEVLFACAGIAILPILDDDISSATALATAFVLMGLAFFAYRYIAGNNKAAGLPQWHLSHKHSAKWPPKFFMKLSCMKGVAPDVYNRFFLTGALVVGIALYTSVLYFVMAT